ncbi:MFS general substrate transporter [Rhodotorula sp. JG-1b]|nr:MFS general substrate transporter [Rhodotorula sp. JG-1b]
MPSVQWYLNKVILVATSILLGAFFVHWLADHALIWQGPVVPSDAVNSALRYYSHIYHAPRFYVTGLSSLAVAALGAAFAKLVLNPVQGLLFDGGTSLLLASAAAVYTSNVLAALRYLPLDLVRPGSSFSPASLDSFSEAKLTEALQSVAASHMIIAVSLTGVLALQGAQGYAERPRDNWDQPVPAVAPAPTPQDSDLAKKKRQYGYHIASLNSLASSLQCSRTAPPRPVPLLFPSGPALPSCLEITDAEFGVITSAYTLGGLGASLMAGGAVDKWGKRATAVKAAAVLALGAVAVSVGSGFWILVFGRILIGIACGIATVVVPLHLASVAPPAIAGGIGILTQISINVGIFAAQAFSIPLSKPMTGNWRIVQLISALVALAQIGTSWFIPDGNDRAGEEPTSAAADEEERAPLARASSRSSLEDDLAAAQRHKRDDDATADDERGLSVGEVLRSTDAGVRKSLWTLVAVMLFQQLSILTAVNPTSAQKVSLFMTLVNLVMTFPAVFLIDRVGRRPLLVLSLSLLSLSTAVLGWAINHDRFVLASAGIIAFVVSFALGLGPVPFVLVGELPPKEAVNWLANLAVGLVFLPLRDALARGSGGTGTVFWIFTAATGLGVLVTARLLQQR